MILKAPSGVMFFYTGRPRNVLEAHCARRCTRVKGSTHFEPGPTAQCVQTKPNPLFKSKSKSERGSDSYLQKDKQQR